MLVDANADANALEYSKDSITSNQSLNLVQGIDHQQIAPSNENEQVIDPQMTVDSDEQNESNEQQIEFEELTNLLETCCSGWSAEFMDIDPQGTYCTCDWDDSEPTMYETMNDITNEEQYAQEPDIYQGWNEYSAAWQYWNPWQYWCPDCAYSFYGMPER